MPIDRLKRIPMRSFDFTRPEGEAGTPTHVSASQVGKFAESFDSKFTYPIVSINVCLC